MAAEGPTTMEGDLRQTPFAHLLVRAADAKLCGTMFLVEPSGVEHVVRFANGIPVKVRAGDRYAMFGELLIEEGALSERTLGEALATRGLLGDVLLLAGRVDEATLAWIAELQFVRRMVHLFELPAETRYRCLEGHDALVDWGGEPAEIDLLALVWAGLRVHAERSARLNETLEAVKGARLRIHAAFEAGRFGFGATEIAIAERMRDEAPTLEALCASGVAPEACVRRVVYALLLTRYAQLGTGCAPVGLGGAAASIARMQLRSVVHRAGAAAPDPAGDGERPNRGTRDRGVPTDGERGSKGRRTGA